MVQDNYFYNYYDLKKHLYRERYYDKKRLQQELDKVYEKWGGERNYIKNYWVNKLWKKAEKVVEANNNQL